MNQSLLKASIYSVLLATVVGCSTQTKRSLRDAPRGVIGVSLLTLENPFFKVIGDTIVEEGLQEGYKTFLVSADKDAAKQGNQVKDFLVNKVAAIVLSPCDSKSIVPVIREANESGVPVFTVDIPCNEPGVIIATQVATDNLGGGREAGRAMIEMLGDDGVACCKAFCLLNFFKNM